jgi:hypothetical protein
MAMVIVLDKPKDQSWTREEAHLVVDRLGCHVERWSKFPGRMVIHLAAASRKTFAEILGSGDFTMNVVSNADMWKEEK